MRLRRFIITKLRGGDALEGRPNPKFRSLLCLAVLERIIEAILCIATCLCTRGTQGLGLWQHLEKL